MFLQVNFQLASVLKEEAELGKSALQNVFAGLLLRDDAVHCALVGLRFACRKKMAITLLEATWSQTREALCDMLFAWLLQARLKVMQLLLKELDGLVLAVGLFA